MRRVTVSYPELQEAAKAQIEVACRPFQVSSTKGRILALVVGLSLVRFTYSVLSHSRALC